MGRQGSPVSNAALVDDLHRVYRDTGCCDSRTYVGHGRHAKSTIWARFGSWTNFLTQAGLTEARRAQPKPVRKLRGPRQQYQLREDRRKHHHPSESPRGEKPCLRCSKTFHTTAANWFICVRCVAYHTRKLPD